MFYLVRHAKACPRVLGVDHPQRALTQKGRAQAAILAQFFSWQGALPVAIYTSPFRRCMDTATPIALQLGLTVQQVDWLRHGGELDVAFDQLQRLAQNVQAPVLIVGHEPELSQLVRRCCGLSAAVPIKKAGVVQLLRQNDSWQVQSLWTYQQILASVADTTTA